MFQSLISAFRYDVVEICALLKYHAPSNGNPLSTFRESVSVPFSRVKKSKKRTLEDGTDTLSQNVGKGLSFDAA
jgi:hypothetical protein